MYNMYQPTPNYISPLSPPVNVVRVNGENGARAYQLPPNSSALLLDETDNLVWLAQTDGAGYKTVTPYKISPYEREPEPDFKSLETRFSDFDERLKRIEEAFK